MRRKVRRTAFVGVAIACLASVATPQISSAKGEPNDPLYPQQWGLHLVEAVDTWGVSNGAGALVAVIDTGVDPRHPDLKANLVRNRDCGAPGDINDGHGTHVAGTIAAIANNRKGVAGVAPRAKILSIRYGTEACDYAESIIYATNAGADVINLSNGYGFEGIAYDAIGSLDKIKDAIRFAVDSGVVVVKAAGNHKGPFCSQPVSEIDLLCVGAVDAMGSPTTYTSHDVGNQINYIVAPGGEGPGSCTRQVLSTWPLDAAASLLPQDLRCAPEAGYAGSWGTSMATPHVSGVAALLAARGLTREQIVGCILDSATDLGPSGRDAVYGYGLVNAQRSVTNCL